MLAFVDVEPRQHREKAPRRTKKNRYDQALAICTGARPMGFLDSTPGVFRSGPKRKRAERAALV